MNQWKKFAALQLQISHRGKNINIFISNPLSSEVIFWKDKEIWGFGFFKVQLAFFWQEWLTWFENYFS